MKIDDEMKEIETKTLDKTARSFLMKKIFIFCIIVENLNFLMN